MTHPATKISIIAEKIIQADITKIVEAEGAKGYTVFEGDGKGQSPHLSSGRHTMLREFNVIKLETIVGDRSAAERIANRVADELFDRYPGIIYLEGVEVLRIARF